MITLKRFRRIEAAVRAAGFTYAIEWSETITPPATAEEFAETIIFVVCSSGMAAKAAQTIHDRCMVALRAGNLAGSVFGHVGKSTAIDSIWRDREDLFAAFLADDDVLAFCVELPFVGGITKFHAAKNLGRNYAKPDVHLERLATRENTTAQKLCERLARQTGYRTATIDTILWRACAEGILNSAAYLEFGWSRGIGTFAPRVGVNARFPTPLARQLR